SMADAGRGGDGRRDERRGDGRHGDGQRGGRGGGPAPRRGASGGGREGRPTGGHRGPRQRSAQTPGQRARTADPARDTAYTVLRSVHEDGAYANLELPRALRRARLRGRDAAFATELTYGTLRMQ